jgi:predicted dehydrogenase
MRLSEFQTPSDSANSETNGAPLVLQPVNKSEKLTKPHRMSRSAGLRVGVVGCGYWGSNYVRILSSLNIGEVVAIDANREILAATATAYPSARPCSDLETALSYVDALIISSPPHTHSELAAVALRKGKHVLIEKPMALSVTDSLSVIGAAKNSKSVLMVGHTFEFNAAVRELKQRLVAGELGRITRINSARLKGPYRSDVSVVWDMVPHDISIMNYLLNSVPSTATAWASSNSSTGIADLAYIKLDYLELGVTGYIHSSWLGFKKVREVTVVGSKKVAVHDDTMKKRLHLFERVDAREDFPGQLLSYGSGPIDSPSIKFEEPLLVQVEHFIRCIENGTPPQTDGANGLSVVAVLEAIDESITTGRTVRVRYPDQLIPTNASEILCYRRAGTSQ